MAKQQAAARKPSRPKRDKQQESGSGAASNGADTGDATYEQELTEYLTERIKPGLNRGAIPLLARSLAKEIARRNQSNAATEESDVDDEPRTEADEEFEDEPRAEADDEEFEDEADEDEPEAEADDEEFEDEADEDEPEAEADDEEFDDEADEDEPEAEADDEEPEAEADDEEPEAEADEDDEEPAETEVSAFEDEMHELQADLGDDWILRFSVQGDEAWLTAEKQDGSQHLEAPTADMLREAVELLDEGGGR